MEMSRMPLILCLCAGSILWIRPAHADAAADAVNVLKVKQVIRTAFRNGIAPSNFDGLTYAYFYQGDYLVYGFRQFCTDIAVTGITPFECSGKTYGTLALENTFRGYLDALVSERYLDRYRFDKPYWSDGMAGATLWTIYILPGNTAGDDSQVGKAQYQKVKQNEQTNSNSGSSWQTDMQSNVSDLKTLIENEKKKQEDQEKQQREFERQIQRQADELNPDIADSQQRLKDAQKATDQTDQKDNQSSKDIFNK